MRYTELVGYIYISGSGSRAGIHICKPTPLRNGADAAKLLAFACARCDLPIDTYAWADGPTESCDNSSPGKLYVPDSSS